MLQKIGSLSVWLGLVLFVSMAGGVRAQEDARMELPPAVSIPGGITRLDEVGIYRVSYRYLDGRGGAMPLGWSGHFEETTGISCTPFGVQDGKAAFLLHPVWRGGVGDTDQTFRLSLPQASHITLRFATAMMQGFVGPGKSDGATFRVFLNDRQLLDHNQTDAVWASYAFDLTPYTGQTITIRFETDPGPKHDPSFDYALWGDRMLDVAGAPSGSLKPMFAAHDAPLGPTRSEWGGASPAYPLNRTADCVLRTRITPEPRSLLEGWSATVVPARQDAGSATMSPISLGFGSYLDLVAPDGKVMHSNAPEVKVTSTQHSLADGRVQRNLIYSIGGRAIHVVVDLYPVHDSSVKVEIRSDDPYIAAVHFGSIGPVSFRREIFMPYLGSVSYLPDLGLFTNVIVDYSLSQASDLDGTTAHYLPLTDGTRNPVRETAYYALSNDLHEVLPTAPNPPSPYRDLLAGKVVLDVWGGDFTANAAWLRELASYHLTHLLTLAHDWQNGGYDNKLPNVLPAQASLGGDTGMKEWTHMAVGLGELIGLHENYADFYPNAALYNPDDVSHDSQNRPVPAWKNLIQSYAMAPTAILKYARMFVPEVYARYGSNAAFLDVFSSTPPWFHVDFRAGVPGAGKFHTVIEAYRNLWQLFRDVHHGPILGEGNHHWYWSGLLDGVEAQFGTGIPANTGESAPLCVDFDLLKIHPLQFNHGMGYVERWIGGGQGGDTAIDGYPTPKTQDQYRMQEIAYGHAGFVWSQFVSSLPFVWQEHNLLWPITERYATAQPLSIDYEVDGRMLGVNAAVAAGSAFDRVRVHYANGVSIYANSRPADWNVEAETSGLTSEQNAERASRRVTLPQYGWLATGSDLLAYTALKDGVVADYAETPTSIFADARTTVAAPPERVQARPSIADFTQTAPGRFRISFAWDVGGRLPQGYLPFVHYTRADKQEDEGIVFQSGIGMPTQPSEWSIGMNRGEPVTVDLPADARDGEYEIKVGIWSPRRGDRLRLPGIDDGSGRILVGTLTVTNGGRNIRLKPAPQPSDRLGAHVSDVKSHVNTRHIPVDFGKLVTDGSVLLEREGPGSWLLTPFPRDTPFKLRLRAAQIDAKLAHLRVEALDAAGNALGETPVTAANSETPGVYDLQLGTVPHTVRYRMKGG